MGGTFTCLAFHAEGDHEEDRGRAGAAPWMTVAQWQGGGARGVASGFILQDELTDLLRD